MLKDSVEEVIAIGAKVVENGFAEEVAFDWFVEGALGCCVRRRMRDSDGSGACERSENDRLEHSAEESKASGEVVARERGSRGSAGRVGIIWRRGSEVNGRSWSSGRSRSRRSSGSRASAASRMSRLVFGGQVSAMPEEPALANGAPLEKLRLESSLMRLGVGWRCPTPGEHVGAGTGVVGGAASGW